MSWCYYKKDNTIFNLMSLCLMTLSSNASVLTPTTQETVTTMPAEPRSATVHPEKLVINGQRPLNGTVSVSGAKNSVLKLISATLLTEDGCIIRNVPHLSDVVVMARVIESLGRKVNYNGGNTLEVLPGSITTNKPPYELVSKMRASFNVLGALLGRYGDSKVPLPGGCSIGKRGVDQHVKGLKLLGAELTMAHGVVDAKASKLKGANIDLDMPSVGATENILLAAVFAEGTTVLSNAAQEPEIADLINFLNQMGAHIEGANTSQLVIRGVKPTSLRGTDYTVMPDRIEAATLMACVGATGGSLILENVMLKHLPNVVSTLKAMGLTIEPLDDTTATISRDLTQRLNPCTLETTFYPGFPTDLQAPIMALATVANGVSTITERVYENRFKHVGELNRMGANILTQGDVAVITGVEQLSGASVKAHDLRAGAALVIAALMAEGYSSLYNLTHLDRGYDQLHNKLKQLGASVQRLPLSEDEVSQLSEVL
jgi:UDP-N-acetylglucosamine 1-carboxyvinyltransferase